MSESLGRPRVSIGAKEAPAANAGEKGGESGGLAKCDPLLAKC
jgi:hypothetical protein